MRKRLFPALLAVATASALALAGCAVDKAQTQSITVACGAMEDLCQKWTQSFTEQTGIQATYVRLSSGEAVARLTPAKNSPEFDVWHGGPADGYGTAATKPRGLRLPERRQDPPTSTRTPTTSGPASGVGVLGFCSNKTVLNKLGVSAPASWDRPAQSCPQGSGLHCAPFNLRTAFTTLWTQNVRLGGQDQAFDYMKKLHGNVLQYTKSGTAPGQIAGRGEVGVGLVFSHDCVKYQDEGMSDLAGLLPQGGHRI